MPQRASVRPIQRSDYPQWRPLWDSYNAFYGRAASLMLPEAITASTWARFFEADEPVHALVADDGGRVVGFAHHVFHRSTTRLHDVCYLQDLFVDERRRGQGIGRALIAALYDAARAAGCTRAYWQTKADNRAGRALYDRVAQHNGFVVYASEL